LYSDQAAKSKACQDTDHFHMSDLHRVLQLIKCRQTIQPATAKLGDMLPTEGGLTKFNSPFLSPRTNLFHCKGSVFARFTNTVRQNNIHEG
jgi:hypothetical protein